MAVGGPRAALPRAELDRSARILAERLAELEERLLDGSEAVWREYRETAAVLASVIAQTAPGARGELLTTAQMAERLRIAPKTLLKRKQAGALKPALQLGKRGRAAIRWKTADVAP